MPTLKAAMIHSASSTTSGGGIPTMEATQTTVGPRQG